MLAGLDHIHRRGLLHRDISADNVMLSYDGDDRLIAKIIDLGVAKDVNTGSSDATMSGVLVGNPKYMSPEQLGNIGEGEQLDGRTDLYSLGIVLYEMLLGVSPFASETPHGYIMKHLTERPPRLADKRPDADWPDDVERVIFRALEKDRRRRFADAREFSAALQPFLIAPAGTLTRTEISRLRRGDAVTVSEAMPREVLTAVESNEDPGNDTQTKRDWGQTLARNTVESYQDFLDKHPNADDSTEAKVRLFELSLLDTVRAKESERDRDALQRLAEAHQRGTAVGDAARAALARLHDARDRERDEEAAFQRAWEDGRVSSWRAFVDANPESSRIGKARKLLEEATAFEQASTSGSETQLREFLKLWPNGRHRYDAEICLVGVKQRAVDAKAAAERRAAQAADAEDYAQAKSIEAPAAWRLYLIAHPKGAHAAEARERLAALEEEAYEAVRASPDEAAAADFLADFPDSPRVADVRRIVAELQEEAARATEPHDFDVAWESGSAAAWEGYLAAHPRSPRLEEATRNRQEANDFEIAIAKNTRSMWRAFLKTWPEGRHFLDAEIRLRAVK